MTADISCHIIMSYHHVISSCHIIMPYHQSQIVSHKSSESAVTFISLRNIWPWLKQSVPTWHLGQWSQRPIGCLRLRRGEFCDGRTDARCAASGEALLGEVRPPAAGAVGHGHARGHRPGGGPGGLRVPSREWRRPSAPNGALVFPLLFSLGNSSLFLVVTPFLGGPPNTSVLSLSNKEGNQVWLPSRLYIISPGYLLWW